MATRSDPNWSTPLHKTINYCVPQENQHLHTEKKIYSKQNKITKENKSVIFVTNKYKKRENNV